MGVKGTAFFVWVSDKILYLSHPTCRTMVLEQEAANVFGLILSKSNLRF